MNYIINNNNLVRRIFCSSKCLERYLSSIKLLLCENCGHMPCKCKTMSNYQMNDFQDAALCSSNFAQLLNCSHRTAIKLLANNVKLLEANPKQIKESLNLLRQYFEDTDIFQNPVILRKKTLIVEERVRILEEIGITKITVDKIIKYAQLIKYSMKQLKQEKIIHNWCKDEIIRNMIRELNAPEEIFYLIRKKLTLKKLNVTPIKKIRSIVLRRYLQHRLQCDENEVEKICSKYTSILSKSCFIIKSTLDVLLNDFQFPLMKIISNGFLIQLNPDNMKNILDQVPSFAGLDIKQSAMRSPRILGMTPEKLLQIEKYIKENNFTDRQLQNSLAICTLKFDTVKQRLKTIENQPEFEMRRFVPKILTVVYSHDLLLNRLNQLKSRGFPSISLNMLFHPPENLEVDIKYKCSVETCQYLSLLLGKNEKDIKQKLHEYPNIIWTSLQNVKKVTNFLMMNGITKDQIWHGIHIVFYSIDIIEKHFVKLPFYEGLQPFSYWKNRINLLHLLLYYIEKESGFTVDNINIGKSEKLILRHFTDHYTEKETFHP